MSATIIFSTLFIGLVGLGGLLLGRRALRSRPRPLLRRAR